MSIQKIALAGALALGMALPATAVTVKNEGDQPDAYSLIDVTQGVVLQPGTTVSVDVNTIIKQGSASGWRSPYDGSTSSNDKATWTPADNWQQLSFFSVGPSTGTAPGVTFSFAGTMTALDLLWGSIDSYNGIEFYLGNVLQAEVSNADIAPAPVNGPGRGASFISISDVKFDAVKFISSGNAFEFANVTATPIPLPAGGVLLLTALGGLAVARRRKQA